MRRSGNDARYQLAALCLQHHLALASRDGHFDKVRGLKRVTW
jgi:predicted nucleic acid-binding protein